MVPLKPLHLVIIKMRNAKNGQKEENAQRIQITCYKIAVKRVKVIKIC